MVVPPSSSHEKSSGGDVGAGSGPDGHVCDGSNESETSGTLAPAPTKNTLCLDGASQRLPTSAGTSLMRTLFINRLSRHEAWRLSSTRTELRAELLSTALFVSRRLEDEGDPCAVAMDTFSVSVRLLSARSSATNQP
jgi:hypothetical protein